MSNPNAVQLTPEAQRAIQTYLLKLSALVGIPTIGTLAIFVVFVLPDLATKAASREIQDRVAIVSDALYDNMTQSLIDTGKIQGQLIQASGVLQKLEPRVNALDEKVRLVENAPLSRIAGVIESLGGDPRTESLFDTVDRLRSQIENCDVVAGQSGAQRTIAECPLDSRLVAGGCNIAAGGTEDQDLVQSYPESMDGGKIRWKCATSAGNRHVQAYAMCCGG